MKNRTTVIATFILRLCGFKKTDRAKRNFENARTKIRRLIKLIEERNKDNRIKIITPKENTKPILLNGGIWQGDSLSPSVFNVGMDKIIDEVKRQEEYRMGSHSF